MNEVTADVVAEPGVEVVQLVARHVGAYPRVEENLFYWDGDESRIFTVTASGRQEKGEWIVTAEQTGSVYEMTAPRLRNDWLHMVEARDG